MTNTRGPLPKARSQRTAQKRRVARLPAVIDSSEMVAGRPASMPTPPADLGEHGLAVWKEAWLAPWTHSTDRRSVEQLARLEDEAAMLRAIRDEIGILLSKPIVTPKGDIAGVLHYTNPVLRELRRIEMVIAPLRDRLGLSPMARARLGQKVIEVEYGSTRLQDLIDERADNAAERARQSAEVDAIDAL